MISAPRTIVSAAIAALVLAFVPAAAGAADLQQPRPGCGFGDDNHNHQAAPGRDPMGLRPGKGGGDANHDHTAPPGQAGGGQPGDPARGCNPR